MDGRSRVSEGHRAANIRVKSARVPPTPCDARPTSKPELRFVPQDAGRLPSDAGVVPVSRRAAGRAEARRGLPRWSGDIVRRMRRGTLHRAQPAQRLLRGWQGRCTLVPTVFPTVVGFQPASGGHVHTDQSGTVAVLGVGERQSPDRCPPKGTVAKPASPRLIEKVSNLLNNPEENQNDHRPGSEDSAPEAVLATTGPKLGNVSKACRIVGYSRWSGHPLPAASRCAKMVLSD